MISFALAALVSAFVLAAVLTPLARRLAVAADLVAPVRPDRLHRAYAPYGGGLAIAATVALVVGGAWGFALAAPKALPQWLPSGVQEHLEARTPTLVRLALGAFLFFAIGLLDDRYNLKALLKLALELVSAAVVVVGFGIKATVWIDVPCVPEIVTILWLVAVVNAYNMLDHMDGLAAAVGIVALVFLAVGQMAMGEWFVPGVALVTAGALAGFLIYNFSPAKVFMGDAGSLTVGYLLAGLMVVARYYFPSHGTSRLVVFVPLVVLAVPLFDAVCVVLSRLWWRKKPMTGDATSHLGHRLLAKGVGPGRAVVWGSTLAAITGVASVLLYGPHVWLLVVAWFLVGCVLAMQFLARWVCNGEPSG